MRTFLIMQDEYGRLPSLSDVMEGVVQVPLIDRPEEWARAQGLVKRRMPLGQQIDELKVGGEVIALGYNTRQASATCSHAKRRAPGTEFRCLPVPGGASITRVA